MTAAEGTQVRRAQARRWLRAQSAFAARKHPEVRDLPGVAQQMVPTVDRMLDAVDRWVRYGHPLDAQEAEDAAREVDQAWTRALRGVLV